MIIHHDPDAFETVISSTTCEYHKKHPGKSYAGCTCSSSYGSVRRDPAAIAAAKAVRTRREEDKILHQADEIRARRMAEDRGQP